MLKVENGEMPPDVARVAIDGRKWIASRFHPNLLSEKLIGNITHQQESLQDFQRCCLLGIRLHFTFQAQCVLLIANAFATLAKPFLSGYSSVPA